MRAYLKSINNKRALIRMNELEKEIYRKGTETISEISQLGKDFAKSMAPVYTGFTYKSIRRKVIRRSSGPEATIYIEPTILPIDQVHRYSPGQYADFNLVRWMHESPKAKKHISSGNPQFMYTTIDYLKERKGRIARGNFNTIKV